MPKEGYREGKTTLAEVAARAGVSISAASKALLGGGGKTTRVSQPTMSKIRRVASELGYRPNAAARQLKTGRSNIIGAIIHSTAPRIYYDLFSIIQQKLAKMGYCFMVGQSDGSMGLLGRYLDEFHSRHADAIITTFFEAPGENQKLQGLYAGLDNVLYLGSPDFENAPRVDMNTGDGIIQIVDHLVSSGGSRIALDVVDKFYSTVRKRIQGYRAGLKKHNIKADADLLIENDGAPGNAAATARRALDLEAQAVAAGNDLRAAAIIRELQRLGRRVPEDIRVTGFDNMDFSALLKPSLTTVDQRNGAVADAAVFMIRHYLDNRKFPENISIKPRLVLRESA